MSRKRKSRERDELVGVLREISGQLAHLVRALDRREMKVVVRGNVGKLICGDAMTHHHQAPTVVR